MKKLFTLIAFCACAAPLEASTPESTLRQFFAALSQRDNLKAWEMLSSDTQTLLENKNAPASKNAQGRLPNHPADFLFSPEPSPAPLEKIELVETDGNRARLRVVAGQTTTLLTMKKEAGQWKLALNPGVSDE